MQLRFERRSAGEVNISSSHQLLLVWLTLTNLLAFLLFAWDKFRAGDSGGNRVSEFNLAAIGAVGGWPGGLVAMLLFRHKTAKLAFRLKYAVAFVVWAGLIYAALNGLRLVQQS
jgi:uncharacterized membrane protein YsdA (DUF1294 family)